MTRSGAGAAYDRAPATALYTVNDGPLYVAPLPDGPILVLDGVAALIYEEATSGPADGWISRVADATGKSESVITEDVRRFVDDLVQRGVLVDRR
jgi:hypothetical protein